MSPLPSWYLIQISAAWVEGRDEHLYPTFGDRPSFKPKFYIVEIQCEMKSNSELPCPLVAPNGANQRNVLGEADDVRPCFNEVVHLHSLQK